MLEGRKSLLDRSRLLDGRRSLLALTGGVALAIMGFGVAIAQDDASESGDDEAEVSTRSRVQLTGEDQVAEAGRLEERGESISRRVMGMLDEARRERDIIRVTCLNDKLTQINAHRRTLESRNQSLQDAVNVADEGRRNHEFTVITVLGQQFTTLEAEAGQCIGQDLFETGSTRIVTDVDPNVPTEWMGLYNLYAPGTGFGMASLYGGLYGFGSLDAHRGWNYIDDAPTAASLPTGAAASAAKRGTRLRKQARAARERANSNARFNRLPPPVSNSDGVLPDFVPEVTAGSPM